MTTSEKAATHTPAPWKWLNYPDGRKLLVARDRAVIHCPDAPITCDAADADLIAAAPDLLAALKAVLVAYDGTFDVLGQSMRLKIAAAIAAVKKAEGR